MSVVEVSGVRAPVPLGSEFSPLVATCGSGWDVGSCVDGIAARHRREWVEGSAAHPDLVAANVETLQGQSVLEFVAGARLSQAKGWGQQLATAEVRRILRDLEDAAHAGGWVVCGLDPLEHWRRPMEWGQFKADQPRREKPQGFLDSPKVIKYENPHGERLRTVWLRVPAVLAQRVADRYGLALPPEVKRDRTGAAGEFWRWWDSEVSLPLVLTEGPKKAGSLLSVGVPAVAVAGIWAGTPKNERGGVDLHPDLAAANLKDRQVSVFFDHSDKEKGRRDVRAASLRLGWKLAAAGAAVWLGACPGPHKGVDDCLVAGLTWEQLKLYLAPLAVASLRGQLRRPDLRVPGGRFLGEQLDPSVLQAHRLTVIKAAMGSGKTEFVRASLSPAIAAGEVRVLVIGHRHSVVEAQAEALGLPTGDDAAPGSDLRRLGMAICIDSLHPKSGKRVNPAEWRGCVVVIDEVVQLLNHLLQADTAVSKNRAEVAAIFQAILRNALAVIAMDAQLDDKALDLIERFTGERAFLIESDHRPAAGRPLHVVSERKEGLALIEAKARAGERMIVWTGAQRTEAQCSAANLAELIRQASPDLRVLVIDSETAHQPGHDASRFATDPNRIGGQYDVLVMTPAVTSGVSIDRLPGHFSCQFLLSGGSAPPEDVIQAAGRYRENVPRYLDAPERAPGGLLRMGSGDHDPELVRRRLDRHEQVTLGQLGQAGAIAGQRIDEAWTGYWCELAASRNRSRASYRLAIVSALQAEGYVLARLPKVGTRAPKAVAETLECIRDAAVEAEDQAVAAAPLVSDREAKVIMEKRRRTADERLAQRRHELDKRWGLDGAEPSPALLQAERDGLYARLRRRFWLEASPALRAAHDARRLRAASSGGHYSPMDLVGGAVAPRALAAEALGLHQWMESSEAFAASDPRLLRLQAQAEACRGDLTQVLGVSPCSTGLATLRALLRSFGFAVEEVDRRRCGGRKKQRFYRIRPASLPPEIDWETLCRRWTAEQLSPAA